MTSVSLRAAIAADRALLEYWDSKPHVIAATGGDDSFDWAIELPRSVGWRELLVAEHRGRPVGFIQIIDPLLEETHYWGDIGPKLRAIDIWIGEESDLGRGFGTRMMHLAIERCFANAEVTAILIDPLERNHGARRFYKRLGFSEVEHRRFGGDDCVVCRLSRETWASLRRHAGSDSRTSA